MKLSRAGIPLSRQLILAWLFNFYSLPGSIRLMPNVALTAANYGRQVEAEARGYRRMQYSAILDAKVCETCQTANGEDLYEIEKRDLPDEVLAHSPDAIGAVGVVRIYLDPPYNNHLLATVDSGAIK